MACTSHAGPPLRWYSDERFVPENVQTVGHSRAARPMGSYPPLPKTRPKRESVQSRRAATNTRRTHAGRDAMTDRSVEAVHRPVRWRRGRAAGTPGRRPGSAAGGAPPAISAPAPLPPIRAPAPPPAARPSWSASQPAMVWSSPIKCKSRATWRSSSSGMAWISSGV